MSKFRWKHCKKRLPCSRPQPGRFPVILCLVRSVRRNGANSIAFTAPTTWASQPRCPPRQAPRSSPMLHDPSRDLPQRGPPQNAHRNAPRGPRCALYNAHVPVEKIGECRLRALIREGGDQRSKADAQSIQSQKLGARSPSTGFFSKGALDFRRKCDGGHVYLHFHRISARIFRLSHLLAVQVRQPGEPVPSRFRQITDWLGSQEPRPPARMKRPRRWDRHGWRRRYLEAKCRGGRNPCGARTDDIHEDMARCPTTHAQLRQHGRDHARCCTPSRRSFDCRPVDARTDSPSPCDVNTADELGACRFDAWAGFRGFWQRFFHSRRFPEGIAAHPKLIPPVDADVHVQTKALQEAITLFTSAAGPFPVILSSVRSVRRNGANCIAFIAPTIWASQPRCPPRQVPRSSPILHDPPWTE